MSNQEKEAAKDAPRFLKAELGNDFFVGAAKEKHPLVDTYHNKDIPFSGTKYSYIATIASGAPWTRKWITWLANALKEIKHQSNSHSNYTSLLERIKDKSRYIEALSVLDIASKLAKVGFSISIEPEVDIGGKVKKPDMKLTDEYSKEKFYVEVSTNTIDEGTKRGMQTMSAFSDLIIPNYPSIIHSGIIHRGLAKKHLDEIIDRAKSTITKCINEKSFQKVFEKGVIELGLTISENNPDFEAWRSKKG